VVDLDPRLAALGGSRDPRGPECDDPSGHDGEGDDELHQGEAAGITRTGREREGTGR
jgi:hypothetical protein